MIHYFPFMTAQKTYIHLLSLLLFAAGAIAQTSTPDEGLYRRERERYVFSHRPLDTLTSGFGIDVHHYALNVRITEGPYSLIGEVSAIVAVGVPTISSITFDLVNALTVDSVFADDKKTGFSVGTGTVTILLPAPRHKGETVRTRVYYHGRSPQDGSNSFTDTTAFDGSRWIFTRSQPYGARNWWPCVDHQSDKPDSIDIMITCDKELTGVTSGTLEETVMNEDGTVTFRWKHRYPIAPYLVAVSIGKYKTFSDWYKYTPVDSMEVVNYVLSNIGETAPSYRINTARSVAMLHLFSSLFGPYPFIKEKYGHVQYGWGGGMEHQTLTSVGSSSFSEPVIAHELAHQWFGNMITCRSWSDLWLNEGFAVFFEAVYQERMHGTEAYRQRASGFLSSAKSASGSLVVSDTASVDQLFDVDRVYHKGAAVLHMLRRVLGDSLFFASINAYATDTKLHYATAATSDLQHWVEMVSGRDMDWFFDQWVNGERYPVYGFSYATESAGAGFAVTVRITQTTGTSNPAFFTMPLDLKFSGRGWDTTVTVFNDSTIQTFTIVLPRRPTTVDIDPQGWILRDVVYSPTGIPQTEAPSTFALLQNYPNPFNPVTVIRFNIPAPEHVVLKVYDALGKEIATLVDEIMETGEFERKFDASRFASGIYVYRITAGSYSESNMMLYVK
jgi:aminopeptidase N